MSADAKKTCETSPFDNTPGGIQSLLAWIADYQLSLSEVLFCAGKLELYKFAGQRLGEIEKMDYYAWEFGQAKSIKHKVIGNILPDGKVSWCDRIYFIFLEE